MAENLANDFATTLASAIDNATGTLVVASASGAPAPNFRIRVDDEIMLVTAVAGTTWTATRGIEGTAAASHASGAVVVHVLTAGALAQLFVDHAPAAADISDSSAVGRAVLTAAGAAAARTAIGAAPTSNPSFTGDTSAESLNGGATSGFKNKIVNGCMRISRMGNGVAILGPNRFGADGLITFIGGWSAVTGAIITRDTQAINDLRYTTGAAHYISLGTCTGASGYVIFQTRIEAADAQELGGKPVTASARLHAWATAPSNYYFRIYKANAVNDFSAQTLVSQSSSFGSLAVNTTVTPTHTFTIPAADCVTGAQVELVVEYTGTIAASSYLFLGDYQFSASSKREPFELRPIAIEEQMRTRYLRQQQVWVGTSTARTVMPIDMVKTPTITGGGAGYTSTGTDKDTLVCYQTTAGLQTLTLNSEL